jgi:hypothetical protein
LGSDSRTESLLASSRSLSPVHGAERGGEKHNVTLTPHRKAGQGTKRRGRGCSSATCDCTTRATGMSCGRKWDCSAAARVAGSDGQPPSPQPPQRPLLTRRGVPHPHPNSDLVLFYMLFSAAGEDGQRDQELLEHAPQAPAARIEGRRQ